MSSEEVTLPKQEDYQDGIDILDKNGYTDALLEVSYVVSGSEFYTLCNIATHVSGSISKLVNMILFRKDHLVIILDYKFNFSLISNFHNKAVWTPFLDYSNLWKGFFMDYRSNIRVHVVKNIVWTKEAHA